MTSEHIPADAYWMLRRVALNGSQKSSGDEVDDNAARAFLVNNGLATWDKAAKKLTATQAGKDFGRLMKKAP